MSERSRASIYFLERAGIMPTRRGPVPAASPQLNIVQTAAGLPVAPPLPRPDQLEADQGRPPPDRGQSEVWPHGPAAQSP